MSTLVVVFAGEYDVASRDLLRRQLGPLESEPRIVFDFTEAKYVDSSCIGELVALSRRRRRKGFTRETVVVPPGETHVKRVFDLCGLHRVFDFARSFQPGDGEVVVVQYVTA